MTWTTARPTKVRGFMITIAQKVFATSGALLLLLAAGIVGCEPKTKFICCTQADRVDQTNSLLWSDDIEQHAFERALQRTIERQEAERRPSSMSHLHLHIAQSIIEPCPGIPDKLG